MSLSISLNSIRIEFYFEQKSRVCIITIYNL